MTEQTEKVISVRADKISVVAGSILGAATHFLPVVWYCAQKDLNIADTSAILGTIGFLVGIAYLITGVTFYIAIASDETNRPTAGGFRKKTELAVASFFGLWWLLVYGARGQTGLL